MVMIRSPVSWWSDQPYLQLSLLVDEKILRLEISVEDPPGVAVGKSS